MTTKDSEISQLQNFTHYVKANHPKTYIKLHVSKALCAISAVYYIGSNTLLLN